LHTAKPNNYDITKGYVFVSYLKKDYQTALENGKNLLDLPTVDVQTFQIMANVFSALDNRKELEKLYKKSIEKFPNSGVLKSEYGEFLAKKGKPEAAIAMWESGIKSEPSIAANYYFAAKYYSNFGNPIWTVIYGETFINIERLTARTTEAKNLLLKNYKLLYTNADAFANIEKNGDAFTKTVAQLLSAQATLTIEGITPTTLAAIRSNMLAAWYANKYNEKYPFYLFDYLKGLEQNKVFSAYNHWLFGAANPTEYSTWTAANKQQNDAFFQLYRTSIFLPVLNQYYAH